MGSGSLVELLRDFPRLRLKAGDRCQVISHLGPKTWEIAALAPPWGCVVVIEEWIKDTGEKAEKS